MLKVLLGDTIGKMLEEELEEELGYFKYTYKNNKTKNSRNGYFKKN